ncbi:oligoketide cyclase/lipid transport protein [Aspergillus flavus]|uniref:Oligoketide cyclase/lipid transport protein n=4 Tax=Aspergillus subgen. Circumdati TaxID=2720871 RepID=A0A7U2MRR4_ASPFN|nr:oligoketide cyclase/lipid transport protein [Aspergillus oryzae 3.042]KAB8243756.1 hypothetical protein BDV35DRAFT_310244 [Aspergillus flavus]KAB8268559.1 hypothetical protein BDV30DRAFT_218192 [Aspergillus minisclerotigenes]KAF7629071.1 hypothetical protein AFLA_004411 [Aspergillus flavus NRRL3357]KDE76634.1 oligoketide cyclase/lipid transport protein [Aspergillus oryzae 100-8]|eukprot:EIT79131.1 oligoketide cyclase/lipid transport protein [Aspergillus oryzae 3.042]
MRPSVLPRHLSRRISPLSPSRSLATPSQYLQRPTIPSTSPTTRTSHLPYLETLRPFHLPSISSLLSNNSNGSNNNNNNGRTLTATRTLPYAPESLYQVISSVESYSQFLPFLTASTVTHRDPETGYPTRAFLTVGYGPLSETFTSRVDCDRSRWIVEARSGAKFGIDSKDGQAGGNFPGANEGIFEYLSTKWELVPLESERPMTKVDLEIRFEFRNQLHAAMMSAVEGQMAGVMIEAFEKRIRDIEGRR